MAERPARFTPTIKDVARIARVSPTTVSNALNGRTHAMTAETLQRIQAAIADLNYHPSMAARGLVHKVSATIGVLFSEIETPLFLQALPNMERLARGASYSLLLAAARTTEDETQAIRLLIEKRVDGIVFFSTSVQDDDAHLLRLLDDGLPVVLVNRRNRHDRFDAVNWNQAAGVSDIVRYLAARGHRRIAQLVGPAHYQSTVERKLGYRDGLEQCDLPYDDNYVRSGDFTEPADVWRQSTLDLLRMEEPPTALIASDDIVASVAIATVLDAGLRVPEDLAIVGIDDQPFCLYLHPTLSTLQIPTVAAGALAMRMVIGALSGERNGVEHVIIPCPLFIRKSSG